MKVESAESGGSEIIKESKCPNCSKGTIRDPSLQLFRELQIRGCFQIMTCALFFNQLPQPFLESRTPFIPEYSLWVSCPLP